MGEVGEKASGGHWVTAAVWWAIVSVLIVAILAQTYTNVDRDGHKDTRYRACLEAKFTPKDCKQ
jgi:hypothetical protein